MGNYYEGNLIIALRKDIPHELHIALIDMCYWQDTMKIPDKWKNNPLFKHSAFERLRFEYGFVFTDEDGNDSTMEYEGENLCEQFCGEDEKWWNLLSGYYVKVHVCLTGYKSKGEDLGQLLVDWLKPYAWEKYNWLGTIEDEDDTYKKDFYLDYTEFNKIQKECSCICTGCDKYFSDSLCNNFTYCERAYKRGIAANKEK